MNIEILTPIGKDSMPVVRPEPQPPYPELTLKKGVDINMASFELGQGSPRTQEYLDAYLHQIRPDWRISDDFAVELFEAAYPVCIKLIRPELKRPPERKGKPIYRYHSRYYAGGNTITVAKIDNNLYGEIEALQAYLDGRTGDFDIYNPSVDRLINVIMERDHYFLIQRGGRRRRVPDAVEGKTPLSDPQFSYFCYYVLEGNRYKVDEFEQMFSQMRGYLTVTPPTIISQALDTYKASSIVHRYIDTHPESALAQHIPA